MLGGPLLFFSSIVSIIPKLDHILFGQALKSLLISSRQIFQAAFISRSGHLSRCCMVCSEVPHSQAVSAASA